MREQRFIEGIFICEEKNRFLCLVLIANVETECYIPSSCRLENFLQLKGKKVLLKKNLAQNNRTKYTVYAIKHKRNYLLLKPAEANNIIYSCINRRLFSFLGMRTVVNREFTIEGYKADIYLPITKTILEIKSIITMEEIAFYPSVYSARSIYQLEKIKNLLQKGYKVVYIFVSLNPYVKEIKITSEVAQSVFGVKFLECVTLGMCCKGYSVHFKNMAPEIKQVVPIIVPELTTNDNRF